MKPIKWRHNWHSPHRIPESRCGNQWSGCTSRFRIIPGHKQIWMPPNPAQSTLHLFVMGFSSDPACRSPLPISWPDWIILPWLPAHNRSDRRVSVRTSWIGDSPLYTRLEIKFPISCCFSPSTVANKAEQQAEYGPDGESGGFGDLANVFSAAERTFKIV